MTTENLEVNNENIKKILNLIQIGKISEAINDLETIKTEILLADISQIEKKLEKNSKKK